MAKLKGCPKSIRSKTIPVSTPAKAASLVLELKSKRKEFLTCLYLNSRNFLIKRETILIPALDRSLPHARRIFGMAPGLKASGVVLLYNDIADNPEPTISTTASVKKIIEVARKMKVKVSDFVVIAGEGYHSFLNTYKNAGHNHSYVAEGVPASLFDFISPEHPVYVRKEAGLPDIKPKSPEGFFEIQNRRFLGNKYKLLNFIEEIVNEKCGNFQSLCDVFSGTGVVGARFNRKGIKVISNDVLYSNFIILKTFLGAKELELKDLEKKVSYLNKINALSDNYFSESYGGTFFSLENARKIGEIREEIEKISENLEEKNALLTSLIYATDKVANTVGHYDAFRKNLDSLQPLRLLTPSIDVASNQDNEVHNEDANLLVKKTEFDVLYMDPPYNSRQYCDAYHLLENLATWGKPEVFGKAKKMDRSHIKSGYCLKIAPILFRELVENARCKHILVSYNNTGDSRDGRSNARISDDEMFRALSSRGNVEIFTRDYKAFTTGKSDITGNAERIFYCKVRG
ncbi:MAG: DNA adenine methylase [Candidatus Omnitrophica bacterium]|nr:DNA adenine methylase [Candidatus Omnitrophota bacterium]